MRLLHVVHSVDPAGGGVIEAVRQLVEAHQRHGHSVEVASLDSQDDECARDSVFSLHALGSGRGGYGYAPRLRSWLSQHRQDYDATILHGLWQYTGFAVWSALRETASSYVVFPHGMLDPWFKRTYPLKHIKKWAYWMMVERHVLRDASATVFTCEEEQRLANESFGNVRCQGAVVNLGTSVPVGDRDTERESFYGRFPQLRGKRLLLFLGRIHEKKGCDLLIKAFAKLFADLPMQAGSGEPLHLAIAGPCADVSYLRSMQSLGEAVFQGRTAPITWTGMLQGEEKWGAYRAAEAFVLPSHQENFGLAVIEALACGVPVLITNKVNIWREIEEDSAGFVEDDSVAGVTRLLNRWTALSDTAREALRAAAASCFRRRFEIESAADKLAQILARVVSSDEQGVLKELVLR